MFIKANSKLKKSFFGLIGLLLLLPILVACGETSTPEPSAKSATGLDFNKLSVAYLE